MQIGPSARALVRLAIALLLVAVAAGVWEQLASQVPDSPFHVGILPGPVGQLRNAATTLALVLFAAAWLMPWAIGSGKEPRWLVALAYAGSVLTIVSLAYGATTGMYGVQIEDPRPDSRVLFAARSIGEGILVICLVDLARRILLKPPAPPSS